MLEQINYQKRAAIIAALSIATASCNAPQDSQPNPGSEPAVIVKDDNRNKIDGKTPTNERGEAVEPSLSVILSTEFNEGDTIAQETFNCDDKIYAVINFQRYETAMYDIRVNWIDPLDKEREVTDFPYFVNSDNIYAWSSLSLHRGAGAGMLQWINPAAGMEEFIGEWKIRVYINNEFTKEENFEIVC